MIFEAFEKIIFENFDTIQLDSSLAAINMYIKRGYKTICHETTDCENGSILVYEVMDIELLVNLKIFLREIKSIT